MATRRPLIIFASEVASLMGQNRFVPKEKSLVQVLRRTDYKVFNAALVRRGGQVPSKQQTQENLAKTGLWAAAVGANNPADVKETELAIKGLNKASNMVVHPHDGKGQDVAMQNIASIPHGGELSERAKILSAQHETIGPKIQSLEKDLESTVRNVEKHYRQELGQNARVQSELRKLDTIQQKERDSAEVDSQVKLLRQRLPESLPQVRDGVTSESVIMTLANASEEVLEKLPYHDVTEIKRLGAAIRSRDDNQKAKQVLLVNLSQEMENSIPGSRDTAELNRNREALQTQVNQLQNIRKQNNTLIGEVQEIVMDENTGKLVRSVAASSYGKFAEQTYVATEKLSKNNATLHWLKYDGVHICGRVDGYKDGKLVELKTRRNKLYAQIPLYEMIQLKLYMAMLNLDTCSHVQQYLLEQQTMIVHADAAWVQDSLIPWTKEVRNEFDDIIAVDSKVDELIEIAIEQGATFDQEQVRRPVVMPPPPSS